MAKVQRVNLEKQLTKLVKQCNTLIDTQIPQEALHASISNLPATIASNYLYILESLTEDLEILYLQSYFYGKKELLWINKYLPLFKSKIIDYKIYLKKFQTFN